MSGAVFTLGNSVSGSLGLGDALSKFGRVAATGLTIEQDPDTVNSYLTTRYAGLSAVTSGGVTTFLNPSLVVIPSAYNNGIVYSLHSRRVNTGDFTVTRNTEARRVNSARLIASVGSGLPRLDYLTSGGTVGTPALLVEPAATNLALQSEAWDVSPWVATSGSQGATVSGNVTTSPDGTTNADKLIEAATTGTHFCLQSLTLTSGTTYTASFFVKASERTRGRFRMSGASAYWDIDFDLTLGTVTGGTNPFIQNFGNGWYRIGGTFTAAQAPNNFIVSLLDASGNSPYTGNGTNGFFVYGAQVEVGSVATSYIPTTTGSVTRNADVVSVSGAVSGSIGQTEGTIYAEVDLRSFANVGHIATISDGTSSNRLEIYKFTDSKIYFDRISATQSALTSAGSSAYTAPTILKIAVGYKSGDSRMYINGVAATTQQTQTFTFGTLTKVNIGSSRSDGQAFNDRIRAAALYTTRLTNAELAALTTP